MSPNACEFEGVSFASSSVLEGIRFDVKFGRGSESSEIYGE